MTREEAKLLLNDNDERETGYSVLIEYQDKCIDKIYNDFESRTCENCLHNKEQDNFMIFCDCMMCSDGSRMLWHGYTKDFGCNKFEKKDEK